MTIQVLKYNNTGGIQRDPRLEYPPLRTAPKKEESIFDKILGGAKDVGVGLLKSGGQTLKGIHDLGESFAENTVGKILPQAKTQAMSQNQEDLTNKLGMSKEDLTPTNTTQKVGKIIGDIAQAFIPAGEVGKAAETTAKALKAGKTVTNLAKAAGEGIGFTALSDLQDPDDTDAKDYALNSALNMFIPGAGAALEKTGLPEKLIATLIKPLKGDVAYGKDPAGVVAKLGIKGNSLEGLAENIAKKKEEIGQFIGNTYTKLREKLGQTEESISKSLKSSGKNQELLSNQISSSALTPEKEVVNKTESYISKVIDDELNKLNKTPSINKSIISRLQDVKDDILGGEGRESLLNQGESLPSLLKMVGEMKTWTGKVTEDQGVNNVIGKIYGKIRQSINEVAEKSLSPKEYKIFKENLEDYGSLISAQNAAERRAVIHERNNMFSMGDFGAGTFGAATAGLSGGTGVESALAGIGTALLRKIMSSTAFKTRLASALSKMSGEESASLLERVPILKNILKKGDTDFNQATVPETVEKGTSNIPKTMGGIDNKNIKLGDEIINSKLGPVEIFKGNGEFGLSKIEKTHPEVLPYIKEAFKNAKITEELPQMTILEGKADNGKIIKFIVDKQLGTGDKIIKKTLLNNAYFIK